MQLVQHKRAVIIRFAVLYFISILLLFILFSAFNSKPAFDDEVEFIPETGNSAVLASVLAREEELRLNYFQLLLSDENLLKAKATGRTSELKVLQQKSDARLVEFDSILKAYTSANTYEPEASAKELVKIREFFRAMLEQRKLAIAVPADQLMPEATPVVVAKTEAVKEVAADPDEIGMLKQQVGQREKELADLQKQLAAKDQQIAVLGRQSKQSQPKTIVKQVMVNGSGDAAAVADLERRNANLVKGINVLQTQVGMLQKNYNLLKAENARLKQ